MVARVTRMHGSDVQNVVAWFQRDGNCERVLMRIDMECGKAWSGCNGVRDVKKQRWEKSKRRIGGVRCVEGKWILPGPFG